MNQDYIKPNEWSIIEEGFDESRVKSSESLFSLGNGAMGQRANFEEDYTGSTFQGSYIAGVYYPDKTRVGWWKNGYPEYFAKVLNAPNWIGIHVSINGEILDLNKCIAITDFRRELNMKEGWYIRSFIATLTTGDRVQIESTRILCLDLDELGIINYTITLLNNPAELEITPFLDSTITNEDTNWNDKFWKTLEVWEDDNQAFIHSCTLKTDFNVFTFMQSRLFIDNIEKDIPNKKKQNGSYIGLTYSASLKEGQTFTIQKFAGYCVSTNHKKEILLDAAKKTLRKGLDIGFMQLKHLQKEAWSRIWEMSDIAIKGDIKAQQGIRFNVFQLNQTYQGKDARLNIGPKGFTGEKYGGSTYWDTEAYCLPIYLATKDPKVAKNLLLYRYNHLNKAIENAEKLGFSNGAALYPMVTMNGEESHNEWEITFEEIHRNGAIAFAIFNYVRYTGDYSYILEKGLEVLIGIARFWYQRVNFSEEKNKYVILGVTGPNEYENNVNNNWYTNYICSWCIRYTTEQIKLIENKYDNDYVRVMNKTMLSKAEIENWSKIADRMYYPYSEKHEIYLQQDGFLDKELIPVSELDKLQLPINQKWSWDRILRSPYIKQADVLQGFYFFEDHFSKEELEKHFDFYEPLTVHESSLSPCVYSIQAAKLGHLEQAYDLFLQTSRLDLDDYNLELEEGCHITSMASAWMCIVEGFGGMRIKNNMLSFYLQIPKKWDEYTFKINFRGQILSVCVTKINHTFTLDGETPLEILVNDEALLIEPNKEITVL